MRGEIIRKYVEDIEGLLDEVDNLGDAFLAWRGFPTENMVIFLFGGLYRYLNFQEILIGHEKAGELDALAFQNDKEIVIEFETYSRNFDHDPNKCDLIVCWEHNWKDCPSNIDILELKEFWEMAKAR